MKKALGLQKCNKFVVGGAPISTETMKYFLSLNMRIFDYFGMSECSGFHTYNNENYQKIGSIGRTISGCLTKVATKNDADW